MTLYKIELKYHVGVLSLIFAAFLFSTFGVFTRLISTQMGVFYQLSARVLIMSFLFLTIALFTRSLKKIQLLDLPLFLFRGVLIILDFSSFYFAVNHLPLGLVLFLFYASSIIISFIVGYYLYHERITVIKIFSLGFALVGMGFIYFGNLNIINVKFIPFAIISGLCFGLTTTTSKKLTSKYPNLQVNLVAYATSALISCLLLIIFHEPVQLNLSTTVWLSLTGFSLVGVGAFYLTLLGFNRVEAQKASLILLAELVFVVIIAFFLYQEVPGSNTILGGLFIIFALALPNISFSNLIHARTS